MVFLERSPARRRLKMVPKTAACVADGEDGRDRPAPVLGQDVVGDVVDLMLLDPDHALCPERLQDHPVTTNEGYAEKGDERPLERADRGAHGERGEDRDQARAPG
jgi:hypothetical protein